MVKNPPSNSEDIRDLGSIHGSRRSPRGGYGTPLQYSFFENPMDRGSWQANSQWGHKESHTAEQLTLSVSYICVCVCVCACICMCAHLLPSCPTLCITMDCSLPNFSVHGILQARILEWIAMSSSRGSSHPSDQIHIFCIAGRFCTT